MAGIFGAWNVDGRPLNQSLAARMSAALAHRGPEEHLHGGESFALGCRMFPEAIRRTSVVFDGRLDNRAELIASLKANADVSPATPDTDLVAIAYDGHGSEFAAHLAGDFALAIIDDIARRLILARDAIGIRPLYFHRSGHSIRFASEIKALLADADIHPRPNDRLLAELLLRQLHRHDHDGSTLFDGIHSVPPAHVVIFTPERTEVRRYWDFDSVPPECGRSFADYAEEFRHHFERAVERRLRGSRPSAVAVSGGVDSSAIFCVAQRVAPHTPPIGFTYKTEADSAADESAYVAALEREYGQTIHAVDPGDDAGVVAGAAELIRRVEAPMAIAQWHRADALVAAVRSSGARTLMTGHWGDQLLFDQAYLVDLLHRGSWGTVRSHLRAYREWFPGSSDREFSARLLSDLLEHDAPRWARHGVRAVRRASAAPPAWDDWYSGRFREQAGPDVFSREAGATALGRALYREVRSRYHELCLVWQNAMAAAHGVDRAFPFLDRDLIQFVMTVPGDVLTRDGVPKALLRESLRGIVPHVILERRTKGDFTAEVNAATRHDHAAVTRRLGPDALIVQRGYVDADKLVAGLAAAATAMDQSSSCTASWRVSALLALELWLQEFFGDRQGRTTDHAKATALC